MILCADDYGISPGVNDAILQLASEGQISAVSCMMTEPSITSALPALKKLHRSIDIGLHIVLTDAWPLVRRRKRFPSFAALSCRAYTGTLSQTRLEQEIRAQRDLFTEIMGRPPDFFDGHQHVQQLPTIRTALARIAPEKRKPASFYCRTAQLPSGALVETAKKISKTTALGNAMISFPAQAASKKFKDAGIPSNTHLLGYRRHQDTVAADAFAFYLSWKPLASDIYFCHPGIPDSTLRARDSLIEARADDFAFLRSQRAAEMLEKNEVSLNRFFTNP